MVSTNLIVFYAMKYLFSKCIEMWEKIEIILYSIVIGMMGWLATLLYNHKTGEQKFSTRGWVTSLVLAGLVGWMVWLLLPVDFGFRDGIIAITWACAMPVMAAIQTYWPQYIKNIFTKKIEDKWNWSKE